MVFEADPYGSFTVNKMNSENKWKISFGFAGLLAENNWTEEDFNKELHKKYESEKNG